jgi:hypothetical protein
VTDDRIENVTPSIAALFDGFFDFAGLFPPASLKMEEMVKAWSRHLDGTSQWMVGRVIVPLSLLESFYELATDLPGHDEDPWCVSVLCKGDALDAAIDTIEAFNERHEGDGIVADVVEISGIEAAEMEHAAAILPDSLFAFFELDWKSDVRGAMAAIAGEAAGAKIRTGGVTPELYPDAAALARFLGAAVRAGVPFKATAGLHHPVPHLNASVPAREYGFLTVLAATAVAMSGGSDDEITTLLEAEDPTIAIIDGGMKYGDVELDRAMIDRLRESAMISIGSCSIDDPIADLTRLGLLGI